MFTTTEESRVSLIEKIICEIEESLKDLAPKTFLETKFDQSQDRIDNINKRLTAISNAITILQQKLDSH
jgi:hypothetical protein